MLRCQARRNIRAWMSHRRTLPRHDSARHQRETYVGPWLPEPVLGEEEEEDVTLPLMLALERLSPLERAAFLLHDVFGVGFEEVAATIRRDVAASRGGDMKALGAMLAADVSVHADGGGKRPAAMQPILGLDAVMKFHEYLAAHFQNNGSKLVRAGFVNGLPGFITLEADGELQTTALEIEGEKIVAIYVVRNPDKLRHLH
jgi:RNA polymerase sigma-70 factor, ECF subfamily